MRAGADAEIILVAPIGEVVPALGAGAGVVGDFVGREAGPSEAVLRRLEKLGGEVVVGHGDVAVRRPRRELRAGLDRQLVERQMRPGEGQRLVELRRPGVERLVGPRVDQVERNAREMGAGEGDRRQGLVAPCARPRNLSAAGSSA